MSGLRPLYDHQQQAIDGLRASLMAGKTRPLLQAPTGFGKTVVAAHIVEGIHKRGKRVCFCVPSLGLIDQTFDRFIENGISPADMGVIQGDHHWRRPAAPIQIATAQTLSRRELPEVDFVVVDECHIRFKVYSDWMAARPDVKFIGLSATPWSRGLGKQFDDLLKPVSLSWLIENGYLSKFRVFAPSKPDLTGVRTVKGDWHEGDLEQVMGKPALVADVVETWLLRADYRPTLCFAVNRKHARLLHEQFTACGVRSEYVDADTPREEREAIGKRLAAGDVHVVVNIGTLTTGIDWDVRCLILARPTKSESLFCLDAETEILTSHGWKCMGEISEGDCVAARTDDGKGCWSRVVATIERDMRPDEAWVEYDAPRANFRVTGNHRMIFRGDRDADYRIADAIDMLDVKGSVYMPTAVSIAQPGVPLTDEEIYFIGMMMTDGTWGRVAGSISQSERHPGIVQSIERCLRKCGIAYAKRKVPSPVSLGAGAVAERHPRWQFSISIGMPKRNLKSGPIASKWIWDRFDGERGFSHLLPFLSKDLSPALMAMSKSQFLKLVLAMHDGDGSKKLGVDYTPRSWEIYSSRKVVVDRLQALSAIHGMTANVRREAAGRKNPIWVITITPKDWRSVGGYSSASRRSRPQIVRLPATQERVWCVQSEAGTIVTRRRGKVTVMGNCQIIGRALRTAEGKDDALILDHSDTHMRLGMVTDIDVDELDSGNDKRSKSKRKERKDPLPKCCPQCTALMPVLSKSCVACGYEMPVIPGIEQVDGDLVAFGGGAQGRTGRVVDLLAKMPRRSVYAQLNHIRFERGRKSGWVAHKYRTIFGNWPSSSFNELDFEDPLPELLSWVRSEDIRFVKSRHSNNSNAGADHAV